MKNNTYQKLWIAGLIAGIIYIPAFIWMWGRWFAEESYYSHGILMPIVTIFLIMFKKDELKLVKPKPNKWGLALIVLSIAIHLISAWIKVYFTSGFSMILLILGLVLYFLGNAYFGKLYWEENMLINIMSFIR